MAGTLMPAPVFTGIDSNGDPLAGALLFTYAAGTTTKQATYTDSALTSAHANPIVLDAAGRAGSGVYLSATSYKFVLAPSTDTDPPASPIWTVDNVESVPTSNIDTDVVALAGEALSARECVYLSDGTGSRTSGSWYLADADTAAYSVLVATGFVVNDIASGASGTVRIAGRMTGFSGLTPGSTYYAGATSGAIVTTPPTTGNVRRVCTADAITSIVIPAQANAEADVDFIGTAGEALTAGACVYLDDGTLGTAGRWYLADADNLESSLLAGAVAFSPAAIASGETGIIRAAGTIENLSSLTAGAAQYISGTAGALTEAAPTNARIVATAYSTTAVVIQPGDIVHRVKPLLDAQAAMKAGDSAGRTITVGGHLFTDSTSVGNVGAGEDDLMTTTLVANSLSADNKMLRVQAWGNLAANANNKHIRFVFGTTKLTLSSAATNDNPWTATVWVIRDGAGSQLMGGWIGTETGNQVEVVQDITVSEDETTALTVKFTGEATTTNDIKQNFMLVELLG